MPMDFPDMKSLKLAAEVWKFRKPNFDETEQQYRTALADFVAPKDLIESCEIRNKVGWDRFTKAQNDDMLRRRGLPVIARGKKDKSPLGRMQEKWKSREGKNRA